MFYFSNIIYTIPNDINRNEVNENNARRSFDINEYSRIIDKYCKPLSVFGYTLYYDCPETIRIRKDKKRFLHVMNSQCRKSMLYGFTCPEMWNKQNPRNPEKTIVSRVY